MRLSVAVAVACLSAVGLSTAADVHAAIKKDTTIPAQPLAPALQQLAKDRDIHLIFISEDIANKQTPGATGQLTTDQALTKLLNGTGLTYQYIDERAITIVPTQSTSAAPNAPGGGYPSSGVWQRFRLAQAEQSSSSSANASAEARERRVTLEEVIVTAQKREERLLDVPISITAVTAEDIDRRGLVSAEDYLRGIPGVNQVSNPLGQVIVIRGIESNPAFKNATGGAAVATYFGETPTTMSGGPSGHSSVDAKLVDIERVEVLRGPQGTTFGSGAIGGAVRTIPVPPHLDRVEGKLGVGYSVTSGNGGDNYNFQGVANVPLIHDKLALRATGYRHKENGFYRNIAGSAGAAFDAAVVTPYGLEAFATDAEEVGASTFEGGRIAALFQVSDALRFTLTYLTQTTETDGWPGSLVHFPAQPPLGFGAYDQALLEIAPEHVVRGQKLGAFDTDLDIANAVMEYNLGWASVLATVSRVDSGSLNVLKGLGAWSMQGRSTVRDNVGEIRLATQLDGPWNFLAGFYAEDMNMTQEDDNVWYGSPESNFFCFPLTADCPRSLGHGRTASSLSQKAAFGEVSWKFLPNFTLTGGVRAYEHERSQKDNGTVVGPIDPIVAPTLDGDASGTSFRGNLSYKLTENALMYAGWSQGFRFGTLTTPLPSAVCDLDGNGILDGTTNLTIESTSFVDSDTVDNYELGGKVTLLDRRLEIAADVYRMEWNDMQVLSFAPGTIGSTDGSGCGLPYNTNAGSGRTEGIEFQANFQITDAFRVDVGSSWTRARLKKDVPAQGWVADSRLPGSPEFNASLGLQYEFTIGGSNAFVRIDPIYVGSFYGGVLAPGAYGGIPAGDYIKVDASARMAIGNTNIDLFVHNLSNADDFTFRCACNVVNNPVPGLRLQPRTIGLQLTYNFGE